MFSCEQVLLLFLKEKDKSENYYVGQHILN